MEKDRDERGLMAPKKARLTPPAYVPSPDPPQPPPLPAGILIVKLNYKPMRFKVQKLPATPTTERWKVTGRNGSIILTNNRPVLAARRLKHFPVTWKNEGRALNSASFQEELYRVMEAHATKSN